MTWPVTQIATGDLVTAAQLNSLPVALAEASGAAASYDFTSIPAFWTHLLIVGAFQTGSGTSIDDLWIRLNGDSTTKYINQYLRASDATVTADGLNSTSRILAGGIPGAGSFSTIGILLANYAVAQAHSAISISHGAYGNVADNNQRVGLAGGSWIPTTPVAITQVTLLPSASTFSAGSIATLYGMGAI